MYEIFSSHIYKNIPRKDLSTNRCCFHGCRKNTQEKLKGIILGILPGRQELDLYLPDKGFAIEYNGCYWHSYEKTHSVNYHMNKSVNCRENNIFLLHIFEDLYSLKEDTYKSIILSQLGLNPKVEISSCSFKVVSFDEEKEFVNKYSLKDYFSQSTDCLGLYYDSDLVLSLSFHENILTNITKKPYMDIPGGIEFLLGKSNLKDIVYYMDRSWENLKDFEKIGFKLDGYMEPSSRRDRVYGKYLLYNCGWYKLSLCQ